MDSTSTHPTPQGPMTRARARALETEVTSLLNDISYDALETWLLPKSDTLCMIRCQEGPPEDACEDGQAAHSTDEDNQPRGTSSPPRPRTSGPQARTSGLPRTSGLQPGNPAPRSREHRRVHSQPRHPGPRPRTSGLRRSPGHPASSPEIRRLSPEAKPPSPDIRRRAKPRTSGPTPGHPASPACAQ